jgi:phage terminase large subunit GpA-like protein
MIEWEPDHPETASFRCPHWEALVAESHKLTMIEAGAWRVTNRTDIGHAGFYLNAPVSVLPNASWSKLAAEFFTDELRVFVNTVLAEGWGAQSDEIDEGGLTTRAEPFSLEAIPVEALSLTCGVDVQSDCLEVSTVAWDKLGGAMVLDHRQIWSATTGLPAGRSAHGLRKAACRRLAEAGCSDSVIAAISGHKTRAR